MAGEGFDEAVGLIERILGLQLSKRAAERLIDDDSESNRRLHSGRAGPGLGRLRGRRRHHRGPRAGLAQELTRSSVRCFEKGLRPSRPTSAARTQALAMLNRTRFEERPRPGLCLRRAEVDDPTLGRDDKGMIDPPVAHGASGLLETHEVIDDGLAVTRRRFTAMGSSGSGAKGLQSFALQANDVDRSLAVIRLEREGLDL